MGECVSVGECVCVCVKMQWSVVVYIFDISFYLKEGFKGAHAQRRVIIVGVCMCMYLAIFSS